MKVSITLRDSVFIARLSFEHAVGVLKEGDQTPYEVGDQGSYDDV